MRVERERTPIFCDNFYFYILNTYLFFVNGQTDFSVGLKPI